MTKPKLDEPTAKIGDREKPCSKCGKATAFKTSDGTYYCPEDSPTDYIAVTGFPSFKEWKKRKR